MTLYQQDGKRITIKEVAAKAQVAISTVSLVMNDKGYVSDETRSRVLKAARQLGYIPTQAARQLAAQRTGNVGFVLRMDHFTRSEPFYTQIFLGTEFEAHKHNLYVLLTTIPETYVPGEHTPRFLRDQNVDGVLVAGKVDPAFLAEMEETGLPFVLIDFEYSKHPSVVIDNRNGARTAVDHLLERGHRRIAFLGADLQHPSLKARLEGYQLALTTSGVPLDQHLIVTTQDGEPNFMTGVALCDKLLACDPMPTAVFCANDALALGVLDRATRKGLHVPQDLAIVGFDDVPGGEHAFPQLTTVRVLKEQLGELAIRYLSELLETSATKQTQYERTTHTITVPTMLVVRESS
ncbi:MAG TPA: LacI family DNA-binding transcriptional regulator [Rhodothermales bacterium]|nr:LacI family DNA-binding transcriptional regulator [Rhodothermales bacterium]